MTNVLLKQYCDVILLLYPFLIAVGTGIYLWKTIMLHLSVQYFLRIVVLILKNNLDCWQAALLIPTDKWKFKVWQTPIIFFLYSAEITTKEQIKITENNFMKITCQNYNFFIHQDGFLKTNPFLCSNKYWMLNHKKNIILVRFNLKKCTEMTNVSNKFLLFFSNLLCSFDGNNGSEMISSKIILISFKYLEFLFCNWKDELSTSPLYTTGRLLWERKGYNHLLIRSKIFWRQSFIFFYIYKLR